MKCILPGISMRIESIFYLKPPLRMTVRNQKRKHWVREWSVKQRWLLSVQVCTHLPPWLAMLQNPIIHQKTNYLLTKISHWLAIKNKMKRKTRKRSGVFSEEIGIAAIKETSNNNIRLTVKRKRILCSISFLRLLLFCMSFISSNLRWSLRRGAIFFTAYRASVEPNIDEVRHGRSMTYELGLR